MNMYISNMKFVHFDVGKATSASISFLATTSVLDKQTFIKARPVKNPAKMSES